MTEAMVNNMKDLVKKQLQETKREFVDYNPNVDMKLPDWLI